MYRKLNDVLIASAENVPKVYDSGHKVGFEEGRQAEYDAFWDIYQLDGSKTFYAYAFAGKGWRSETFKPKYPMAPVGSAGCEGMFYYFARIKTYDNEMIDFTEISKMLDFSGCTRATNTFRNACIKNLYCDFSNCTQLTYTFAIDMGGMIDFITLKVSEKATSYNGTFIYASSLTDLKFTEDSVIAASIDFQWSPKLNKASIESIINALSTTESGLAVIFSKTAVNNAFGINVDDVSTYPEGSEYYNLRHSKSKWTFYYT